MLTTYKVNDMDIEEAIFRLTDDSRIRVKKFIENDRVIGFVLNLECLINNKMVVVYRADTCHGYPHEQKFWRSPKPIPKPEWSLISFKSLVSIIISDIEANHMKWKNLMR